MKILRHISSSSLLGVAGLLAGAVMLPAIAQGTIQLRLPDISAPGNRESGSTRSTTCIDTSERLVALMPETNYGLTQSDYPTFYFYLPDTTAEQLKFVMLNESTNELIYEGKFSIGSDEGIASISLPDNGIQQPLAVGESYVWYISVICDEADPSADVVTEGYVERVAPLAPAAAAPTSELPALYAAEGLWYDAIAASALLKQVGNDPTAWNTLLDAVELNQLIPVQLLTEDLTPSAQASTVE